MLNSIEDWTKSLIQVYTLRNYKKNQMKAKRSKEEVDYLMDLFVKFFTKKKKIFIK